MVGGGRVARRARTRAERASRRPRRPTDSMLTLLPILAEPELGAAAFSEGCCWLSALLFAPKRRAHATGSRSLILPASTLHSGPELAPLLSGVAASPGQHGATPSSPRLPPRDAAEVRRAYLHAIKRIHPDKLGGGASAAQRLAAAAVFEALREAEQYSEQEALCRQFAERV